MEKYKLIDQFKQYSCKPLRKIYTHEALWYNVLSQVDMNPAFVCFFRKASQLIGKKCI